MDFQQLLQIVDRTVLEQVMLRYHVEENERKAYYDFMDRLLQKEKNVENGILNINIIEDEDFPDINAGVLCEDGVNYAIDFIPWETCLGYEVDEASMEQVGKEEFAFHFLYDMSFDGFHEEVREANIKQLTDRVEAHKNGEAEWMSFDNADELFALIKEKKDDQ